MIIKSVSNLIYSDFIKKIIFTILLMSLVFSRSFLGLYIFNYRIGEYLIAFALVLFLFTTFINFEDNPLKVLSVNLKRILILLFLFFILTLINSNASALDPYTYKTSSYIWTISFLFLGISSKKIKISVKEIQILQFAVIFVYFSSIYGYPKIIIDLILQFSDKYELHKGSDLALFFIITSIVINDNLDYEYKGFQYFIVNSSIFLPLLLFKSRSAFLACFVVFTYEAYKYLKHVKLNKKQSFYIFSISILLLSMSTFLTQNKEIPEEINPDLIAESYSSLADYRLKHYQQEYPLLYLEDGRILSGDGNLNWRLIMWQDSISDNVNRNKILLGVGYKDKLSVFEVNNTGFGNDRRGLDQLNEQVHNYFLTIFLRGGLVQLFIVLVIYFLILNIKILPKSKISMVIFVFCSLFISSFDSSMENSHFPLIFYYFIGNFYLSNKLS